MERTNFLVGEAFWDIPFLQSTVNLEKHEHQRNENESGRKGGCTTTQWGGCTSSVAKIRMGYTYYEGLYVHPLCYVLLEQVW